ncbi:MAG: ABC transporter permease, partial [Clostridia bacterium]|nr:ABC transporter permease [Clostridia bacterium]
MNGRFSKFSPFHVDPEKIEKTFSLTAEDFVPANDEEKAAMEEKHKSVSYWRDAWRRFRSNTVSMVALVIFIICLLFAFLGPALIPYSYDDQYRTSQKMGPFEYSKGEELIKSIADSCDGFYATALRAGSITALNKGNYFIKDKGKIYAFTLDGALEKSVIVLRRDDKDPLIIVKEDDIKNGSWSKYEAISYTDTAAEDAMKLELSTGVFPHVFGTDSAGRDLMARTMYGTRVSIIIGVMAAIIVLIIGATYGAISGLSGGKVDFVMMRIVELIYSIPEVLVVLLLQVVLKDPLTEWFSSSSSGFVKAMSSLGSGIISIFITFALLYWVTMARIVRGQVLQLKQQEYVT